MHVALAAQRFAKYEGTGNDFIVVDSSEPRLDLDGWRERAVRLCNRHFGIGADGLLLVLPPESASSRARMLVVNADGSRPEMCGNGLRCVGLHLARQDGEPHARYVVDTDAGPLHCDVEREGERGWVSLGMGRATVLGEHCIDLDGSPQSFVRVSTGNPHAVIFDTAYDAVWIDRWAPDVSSSIPGGANVGFVRQRGPGALDLLVWERGVGRTLACGTGAVAAVAAACALGRAPFDIPVSVNLPGGELEVIVAQATGEASLRGPARLVFVGELCGE
jgi:diaminopimelate epimerase